MSTFPSNPFGEKILYKNTRGKTLQKNIIFLVQNSTFLLQFNVLLSHLGDRLRVLYLIHLDEVDLHALAVMSNQCRALETLGLYNCTLREIAQQGVDQEDYADRAR